MPSAVASELVERAIREGLLLVLLLSAPPLLASLTVGLIVGALQSSVQIQESSITFVPKLAVTVIVLLAIGPALGAQVVKFAHTLLAAIPLIR
jgi:flagellar biosynthesis protein FliQ